MLILYRKPGEGVEIKNKLNGRRYDFDFMYNEGDLSHYRINGEEKTKGANQPFYLDDDEEVLVIIINCESSVRLGIDGPRYWNVRRKEIPENKTA